MQLGDGELMRKVKEGDMNAFDVLVRRWEHQLFNVIYKIIGDFQTAEDVRQEVLLRVYKAARRYRPQSQFKTWLYRIAINCSINELRKRERRRTLPLAMSYEHNDGREQPLESILPDPNPQPDEIVQQDEIAEHIQDALRRLPDERRIVIVLRHYEGLKFSEIASMLDCPLGTVKSRMRHGLEQLRVMLKHLRWEGEANHGL
jgi:RNA polymerase sigma-70 factor (ECF subfamily)